jgi:hypothetical protein
MKKGEGDEQSERSAGQGLQGNRERVKLGGGGGKFKNCTDSLEHKDIAKQIMKQGRTLGQPLDDVLPSRPLDHNCRQPACLPAANKTPVSRCFEHHYHLSPPSSPPHTHFHCHHHRHCHRHPRPHHLSRFHRRFIYLITTGGPLWRLQLQMVGNET